MAECVWHFNTGSIYRPEVAERTTAMAANPTLLQPGSRRWSIHYGALPFLSYMPLDPARHAGLVTSKGPRALTQVRGQGGGLGGRGLIWCPVGCCMCLVHFAAGSSGRRSM